MKTITKILGSLSIIAGVWVVFLGISIGADNGSSFSVIVGGGLFMTLGVTAFVLYRD